MKKILLGSALSAALFLAACGGKTEEPEAAENEVETTEKEETESENNADVEIEVEAEEVETEEHEEELSDKGTRSNPYLVGETAEIKILDYDEDYNDMKGIANISFDNVLRGDEALNEINEGSGTIEVPEDGTEWMTFDFTFELTDYVDDDTRYTFATNFPTYNENGEQFIGMFTGVGEQTGNSVYQGGKITSRQALTVPKDENILIGFSDAEEDILFKILGTESDESDDNVKVEDSEETEEIDQEEDVAKEESNESQTVITDHSTLESIIYGNYTEVEKIAAYNSAVANGVIPQGTVSEGSAVSAYESSIGLQNGETEDDQMRKTYQSWVDAGLMTEEEMELELAK